jgi:hypothetical protein
MNYETKTLVNQAKTTYHPNVKIEYLLWQLALALEEAYEEIKELKSRQLQ